MWIKFLLLEGGGGGGANKKSLKIFAPPVQFLTDMTPLDFRSQYRRAVTARRPRCQYFKPELNYSRSSRAPLGHHQHEQPEPGRVASVIAAVWLLVWLLNFPSLRTRQQQIFATARDEISSDLGTVVLGKYIA